MPYRKYHNQRTPYNGRVYASILEASYARTLDLRQTAGEVRAWRPQIRIPLLVNGEKICDYVVDFEVTLADGSRELVETKGMWTPAARLKRKIFEATWLREHPDVRYRVVSRGDLS